MSSVSTTAIPHAARPHWLFPETWSPVARAAVMILVAVGIAYAGTLSAPFVFDDIPGIVRNSSIRQVWPLSAVLFPNAGPDAPLIVRPLVNLTFAINYAAGGLNPWGYHAVNLLIHACAGILCTGLVSRTFRAGSGALRLGPSADMIALLVALGWTLHPALTESVSCVIRRGESLAAVCLFLMLFAFIRASETTGRTRWLWSLCAVCACGLGIAANELMIVAPVLVLLYDRAYLAASWRGPWHRRSVHGALFATSILVTFAFLRNGIFEVARGSSPELGALELIRMQCRALLVYLKLVIWPNPLVLDYDVTADRGLAGSVVPTLVCLGLVASSVVAWFRRPAIGFVGIWFLLTLAPSSIVFPGTSMIAEHRLYLPVLAPLAMIGAFVFMLAGRRVFFGLIAILVGALWLTALRNKQFESALTLWSDTVVKARGNARARYHYANALSAAGRAADAAQQYRAALRLAPRYAAAHHNLAGTLLQLGEVESAVSHYTTALELEPNVVDPHVNLAAALIRLGRIPEAIIHYESAAKLGMLPAESQLHYGRALAEVGRIDEALVRLLEAARLNPNDAETLTITGMVLSAAGRTTEALQYFTRAVIADPADAEARAALGDLLIESDRPAEALVHYQAALKLRPAEATLFHTGIGHALIRLGRAEEAIVHYETALQLNPDNADAQKSLGRVRAAVQRRGLLKN